MRHPLADRGELHLADLADQRWIFMAGHDPYRHRVDGLFQQAGIERRFAVETPNSATLCAMALEGVGIGIINPFTAIEYAGRGLTMRPLGVKIPFMTTLMTSAHRPRSPLIEQFVDALIAVKHSYLDRIDLQMRELGSL